jgi:hypothetical protein
MSPAAASLVRRSGICLGIILLAALLLRLTGRGLNILYVLVLPPAIIAIGAVLSPALSDIVAGQMRSFFHPGRMRDRPRPAYSTIEAMRIRGEYREALEELEFVVLEAPGDPEAWEMMIGIACDMGDACLARDLFGRGVRALEAPGDRDRLSRVYRLRTGQLRRREAVSGAEGWTKP